ncbi:VOC family protein [Saccharopolyspora griseoalba]|uniref:VOC family protein n=1 Tax=Saccharopolyspora griseoalba TaxID=1431848 RepID=A0ABW2LGY4_9PSEU
MTAKLNPYLSFAGDAKQAMEFYRSVLGGELELNTYGEAGDVSGPLAEKIMHAMLTTDRGFALMASDAPPETEFRPGTNFAISISGEAEDAEALRGYWSALAEGGQVQVPMEKQMWGDEFGMLTDKHGISWMIDISGV